MRDFKNCILACDVDGTLIAGDILPKQNIEKIAEFAKLGGTFALATGRSVGAVGAVLEKLKQYIGASVVANGCMIYDYSTDKVLWQKTIPDSAKRAVFEACARFDEIGVEIHSAHRTFILKDNREVRDHQSYEGLCGAPTTPREVWGEGWNKALFTCENPDKLKEIDAFFEKWDTDAVCVPTNALIYGKNRTYREILPKGVNKASTLFELCKILNIKKGGFFAIGDYFNDLQMLKQADVSACPCTSPDEVKAACNYHTKSASQGAVADFIDYLIDKEIEK